MDFEGEGRPLFLNQAIKAGLIFPSMDGIWYGCNTNADPLFYNAVANNGVSKAQFVSEIKEWNKTIVKMEKEVINPQICSTETL
jgi:cell division protein FtsI (penicillin-binding protein 3)